MSVKTEIKRWDKLIKSFEKLQDHGYDFHAMIGYLKEERDQTAAKIGRVKE